MSVSGYNPKTKKNQELQSERFLQPLATPGAEGNYALCPYCEGMLINPLQLHGEYNNNNFKLENLRGVRKYHCGSCGSDVTIERLNAPGDKIKLRAYTNRRLFGHKIPTWLTKKQLPIGWNFMQMSSAGTPQPNSDMA